VGSFSCGTSKGLLGLTGNLGAGGLQAALAHLKCEESQRLLLLVVMQQREDVVILQLVASVQEVEFDHEPDAANLAAELLH
jgi:hypothetical protein